MHLPRFIWQTSVPYFDMCQDNNLAQYGKTFVAYFFSVLGTQKCTCVIYINTCLWSLSSVHAIAFVHSYVSAIVKVLLFTFILCPYRSTICHSERYTNCKIHYWKLPYNATIFVSLDNLQVFGFYQVALWADWDAINRLGCT